MILLTILIVMAIIGFFLAQMSDYFDEPWGMTAFVAGIVSMMISFLILITCGLNVITIEQDRAEMYEEYESIIIYQPMVEESSDLMLHWRHNKRVEKWNEEYTKYEKERENIFCGMLFRPNIYVDCDTIKFESSFESQFVD